MTNQKPRTCFYIPHGQRDEHGYIPSLVTENEPGHSPLKGNGSHAQPWYWGPTYEEAERVCAAMNRERFGLTPEQAAEIVLSSMAAQDAGQVVIDVSALSPGDPIPNHPLGDYVLGECGHGVAASEWRAGFRNCEHCGEDAPDDGDNEVYDHSRAKEDARNAWQNDDA